MANEDQLNILKRGVEAWNKWREQTIDKYHNLDLSGANLSGANLFRANLSGVDLSGADLSGADLSEANLQKADLRDANLTGANLYSAVLFRVNATFTNITGANLTGAFLDVANLTRANLTGATLYRANLAAAHIVEANVSEADLSEANLMGVTLVGSDFTNANLSGCRVFGVSAWKLKLEGTIQTDLIITEEREPIITVDKLEVAQFIYLLLHNEKLRDVIDTVGNKAVLILGRFSNERKAILDAVRDELREGGKYIPIIFDFEGPTTRNLTETVGILARLSRFVIADLSDPNSIPHEIISFIPDLLSVPVQPLFCPTQGHPKVYPMFKDLQEYPQVLGVQRYKTKSELLGKLPKIIERLEKRLEKQRRSRKK